MTASTLSQTTVNLVRDVGFCPVSPFTTAVCNSLWQGQLLHTRRFGQELDQKPGRYVPGNVAVKRPNTRIAGSLKLYNKMTLGRNLNNIPTRRIVRLRDGSAIPQAEPDMQDLHVKTMKMQGMPATQH